MKDNTPKNDGLRKFDKNIRKKFNELPIEKQKKQKAPTFILYQFELNENQKKSFEDKIDDAFELCYNHLIHFKRCFGATSFGMDSIVMMDIMLRAWEKAVLDGHDIPKPDFFLNDTLNTFKEEKKYWTQMTEFFNIKDNLKIFKPPLDKDGKQNTVWTIAKKYKHLPSFRALAGGKKLDASKGQTPECCNILKKKTMKYYLKGLPEPERYDCHFIGTRAEESRMRAMSLMQRCRSYLITSLFPHPIRAVTPLGYLTTDVWKEHQGHYENMEVIKVTEYCQCGHKSTQHEDDRSDYYDEEEDEVIHVNCKKCDCNNYIIVKTEKKKTGKFKKTFVPNENEIAPENDIELYYKKYNIPKNPAYEAHNMERMGCASCPAHINWEIRLAKDPTNEGLGMLRQNFKLMSINEHARLEKSIKTLQKYLDNRKSYEQMSKESRIKVENMIKEFV